MAITIKWTSNDDLDDVKELLVFMEVEQGRIDKVDYHAIGRNKVLKTKDELNDKIKVRGNKPNNNKVASLPSPVETIAAAAYKKPPGRIASMFTKIKNVVLRRNIS